jgi:hypothetical protein
MRILVCGGRDYSYYDNYITMCEVMDEICEEYDLFYDDGTYQMPDANKLTIIHGGARGADNLIDRWAVARGLPMEVYPAEWHKYGNKAGFVRNMQMLSEGKPDLVVAFPGGRGTAHMVTIAEKHGVPVHVVN